LTVYFLLLMPPVQQKIASIAIQEVTGRTNSRISVGKLRLRLFNRIRLQDVYIEDLKGDTLLFAEDLSADFRLLPLLRSHLSISSVKIDGLTCNINRDSINSPFNFRFLIDAFASEDTTASESNFSVAINHIRISNSSLSCEVLSAACPDSLFDVDRIRIDSLNAHIELPSIDMENLDVGVRSLSFRERSGFLLKNLGFSLRSDKKKISLANLQIELPHSIVKIEEAGLDYTGMELSRLTDSAKYELALEIPYLSLADLKAFSPSLSGFADSISLSAAVWGRLPSVNVGELKASCGQNIRLAAQASVSDVVNWEKSPLELQSSLQVKEQAISRIIVPTDDEPVPVRVREVLLKTDVEGSLPDLRIRLSANSTPSGTLNIDGTGGYIAETGAAHFNVAASADNFSLQTLLNGNPDLGLAGFTLNVEGHTDSSRNISAVADLNVRRFDFRKYPYRNIDIHAGYAGSNVSLHVQSCDLNVPLLLKGKADLSDNQTASLYLRAAGIKPGMLNLTEDRQTQLYAVLTAEVEGFNPDRMRAEMKIDSISFATGRGAAGVQTVDMTYNALPEMQKQLTLDSKVLAADLSGRFSVNTIAASLQHTLAVYFPEFFPVGDSHPSEDRLKADFIIRNAGELSNSLNLPVTVPGVGRISLAYAAPDSSLELDVLIPQLKVKDMSLDSAVLMLRSDREKRKIDLYAGTKHLSATDTMRTGLKMETYADSILLNTAFDVRTSKIDTRGNLNMAANFKKSEEGKLPDILIRILPSPVTFNRQNITIEPARIAIKGEQYEVDNFEILLSENEYLKVQGKVSPKEEDSISVALAGIRIETIMHALQSDLNLTGEINGTIIASRLLTHPRILTDGFSVKDVVLAGIRIGTLNLRSIWSDRIKGMLVHAELERRENARNSVISGFLLPQMDSIGIRADIRDMEVGWIQPFTGGMLYGLDGSISAEISATGKMKKPQLSGAVVLNNVSAGVSKLNVLYHISDSIRIQPDRVVINNFKISDGEGKQAVINGKIHHSHFADIRPDIKLEFNDFALLNNPRATDSLFYGTFRLNGSIAATGSDRDLQVKAAISNSPASKIFINLPAGKVSEARMYSGVTFISKDSLFVYSDPDSAIAPLIAPLPTLPVKIDLTAELTPDLEIGVIINPQTGDMAKIKGGGNVNLSYDMASSAMTVTGDYKITEGECNISYQHVVKRAFSVEPGGMLTFTGDPAASTFDVTAVYRLRADLLTLDPVFGNDPYLSRTRVNTECRINVKGSINKMDISYAIVFPGINESVQKKADAIMYTDDIKLKEIAYLLVTGSFYSPASDENTVPSSNSLWTSLASSALTNQLNKLLEGVLSENWTIGTDIHANDADASDLEMDVNISTSLLHNRMIISSNIGYSQNAENNLTGDFEVQYKLIPTGELVLKMYNAINDQYYVQALTTRGAGIVYRREEKRFRDLFKKIKRTKTKKE
jgi:hypothetical protein